MFWHKKCSNCGKRKADARLRDVQTEPAGGWHRVYCDGCAHDLDFNTRWGIHREHRSPGAKFVRFEGRPVLINGGNAYGSIVAVYDDGSRLGVICGHGGSAFLHLDCAEGMMKAQQAAGLPPLKPFDCPVHGIEREVRCWRATR